MTINSIWGKYIPTNNR